MFAFVRSTVSISSGTNPRWRMRHRARALAASVPVSPRSPWMIWYSSSGGHSRLASSLIARWMVRNVSPSWAGVGSVNSIWVMHDTMSGWMRGLGWSRMIGRRCFELFSTTRSDSDRRARRTSGESKWLCRSLNTTITFGLSKNSGFGTLRRASVGLRLFSSCGNPAIWSHVLNPISISSLALISSRSTRASSAVWTRMIW